jgi:hypothetical protein
MDIHTAKEVVCDAFESYKSGKTAIDCNFYNQFVKLIESHAIDDTAEAAEFLESMQHDSFYEDHHMPRTWKTVVTKRKAMEGMMKVLRLPAITSYIIKAKGEETVHNILSKLSNMRIFYDQQHSHIKRERADSACHKDEVVSDLQSEELDPANSDVSEEDAQDMKLMMNGDIETDGVAIRRKYQYYDQIIDIQEQKVQQLQILVAQLEAEITRLQTSDIDKVKLQTRYDCLVEENNRLYDVIKHHAFNR